MFMAGVGGMGGAGQDLISSCSSLTYSGDEIDFENFEHDRSKPDQPNEQVSNAKDWKQLRQVLVKLGHFKEDFPKDFAIQEQLQHQAEVQA